MEAHILIEIRKQNTDVSYIENGDKLHVHTYDYGHYMGKNRLFFMSGILYMMEIINTIDVIPNKIIIKFDTLDPQNNIDNSDMRHNKDWYKDVLVKYNYTQFIKRHNIKMHVIINYDERHKKPNPLELKH